MKKSGSQEEELSVQIFDDERSSMAYKKEMPSNRNQEKYMSCGHKKEKPVAPSAIKDITTTAIKMPQYRLF